ncbi:hypothetical protein GQ607_015537 [Colletotrichum asianum]|uniref:DUF1868 domain-containing protein n=1 Tax=Colletotrichum asianum TaxID=702518 RepID=A0A8H3VVF5_9PEZI|nr:hypothetical protein GQ607_015537 [Colletotrichum asianum]
MRFFLVIALSAISIGQASAQAPAQETVSTSCKTVPECGQNNIGAACTTTCQDNGVSDQVRRPGYWPSDLALDATQETCNEHFEKKLRKFSLGTEAAAPYRMVLKGIDILDVGVAVRLDVITPAEVERLRALRDRLADELKIRHPIHDEYGFHISMVYFLRHPNGEQKLDMESILKRHFEKMAKEIELGPPEFCLFGNMHAFDPVFYLS